VVSICDEGAELPRGVVLSLGGQRTGTAIKTDVSLIAKRVLFSDS